MTDFDAQCAIESHPKQFIPLPEPFIPFPEPFIPLPEPVEGMSDNHCVSSNTFRRAQ